MAEPTAQPIARTYAEFIDAIAARVAELNVSYEDIDEAAGFTTRYTGKLLSHGAMRSFGPMSFDTLMQVLGTAVVLVPDPTRAPVVTGSREVKGQLPGPVQHKRRIAREVLVLFKNHMGKIGRKGAKISAANRMLNRTAAMRRRIAKQAAKARWSKPRITEIKGAAAARARDTSAAKSPLSREPAARRRCAGTAER